MSKITKKQLQQSVDLLDKENSSQHDYLMRINRALKSIDIDILSAEFDEPEPQLKQLDQSVFDGLDEKWRFAAINKAGRLMLSKSTMASDENYWHSYFAGDLYGKDTGYDASNWQNSLIERDDIAKELTGSDLCREVLKTRRAVARVSDISDFEAADLGSDNASTAVLRQCDDGLFYTTNGARRWFYAVLINNQGEPLTAAEVGL